MPRIFLPLGEDPHIIHITGEKARYLMTVLRCKEGEELEVLDGKGLSCRTRIISLDKKEVVAEVTGVTPRDTESRMNLILVQGILKGEKMEWVIQKTAELGIKEIIPAVTERSQVRETRKTSRWKKIAEDASRQSGRTAIPMIHEPVHFSSLFSGNSPYNSSFRKCKGLLLWEEGGTKIKEVRDRLGECMSMIIAVGPEGGFTEGEAKSAESRGFFIASLGNRILRAETAAISATTIVQFLFGDLG